MKKSILFLVLVTAYNLLFWEADLGINVLIFTLLSMGILYRQENKAFEQPFVRWITTGTLWAALMIVANNSLMSKMIFILSFITWIGFVQQRHLKLPLYAFGSFLFSLFILPFRQLDQFRSLGINGSAIKRTLSKAKVTIIPIVGLFIFHGMYSIANPKFATLSNSIQNSLFKPFDWNVDEGRLLFILFSMLICGVMLSRAVSGRFTWLEHGHQEQKARKRKLLRKQGLWQGFYRHFKSGTLFLFALNGLLLVVNSLDFWYVWLGKAVVGPKELSQYVHDGTFLLIFAIVLAMVVVLYYFKGQMHFFSNNKKLKQLSYFWIAQNAFMVISVAIRNLRYIDFYGLSYLRIGVFLFLLIVVAGLITMSIKVKDNKTVYYLILRNSWVVYTILLVATTVNWDVAITRYNIFAKTEATIDAPYLIYSLSDKNLTLLEDNRDLIEERIIRGQLNFDFSSALDRKHKQSTHRKARLDWRSWNWVDR